jgi:hypothetical protein
VTWTAVNVRLFVRATRVGVRSASSWGAIQAQAAAVILKRSFSEGAAWSSEKATRARDATARASIGARRMYHSRAAPAALRMRHAWNGLFPEEPPVIGQTHRALVVRRSTALIRFEPKRSGLAALRPG